MQDWLEVGAYKEHISKLNSQQQLQVEHTRLFLEEGGMEKKSQGAEHSVALTATANSRSNPHDDIYKRWIKVELVCTHPGYYGLYCEF